MLKKTSQEVAILTVFSKSLHAPNFKVLGRFSKTVDALNLNLLRRILVGVVSKERQKEDQRFCDSLCAVQKILPFKDSFLRGYIDPYINEQNIDKEPLYNAFFRAIERRIFSDSYDSILCPLAVGNQVDHLIVMKAFSEILKKNKDIPAKVFFYEDLPYASAYSLDFISSLAWERTGSNDPLFIDVTVEMPLKQKLVDIYRSQSNREGKERILYHAKRLSMSRDKRDNAEGYCERIWRTLP